MPGNSEEIKALALGRQKVEFLKAELAALGHSDWDIVVQLAYGIVDIARRAELERGRQKKAD